MNTNMTGLRWLFKNLLCILVLWAKVASAIEGLKCYQPQALVIYVLIYTKLCTGLYENFRFMDYFLTTELLLSILFL